MSDPILEEYPPAWDKTDTPKPKMSLDERLMLAAGDLEAMHKSGWNKFHKYAFIPGDLQLAEAAAACRKRGVLLIRTKSLIGVIGDNRVVLLTMEASCIETKESRVLECSLPYDVTHENGKPKPADKSAQGSMTEASGYLAWMLLSYRREDNVEDVAGREDQPAEANSRSRRAESPKPTTRPKGERQAEGEVKSLLWIQEGEFWQVGIGGNGYVARPGPLKEDAVTLSGSIARVTYEWMKGPGGNEVRVIKKLEPVQPAEGKEEELANATT